MNWTNIGTHAVDWSKTIVSVGFAGIVAWYLLTKTVPEAQDKFHEELREERKNATEQIKQERDRSNERQKMSREHAREVTNTLSEEIRTLTRVIDSHNSLIRDNQWKQIEYQKKQIDVLKQMEKSP